MEYVYYKHKRMLRISFCDYLPDNITEVDGINNEDDILGMKKLCFRQCAVFRNAPKWFVKVCTSIQEMEIMGCTSWTTLPSAMVFLSGLRKLRILNCDLLETFFPGFGMLRKMEELHISHCDSLEALPEDLSNLSNLKRLEVRNCDSLQAITLRIGKFKNLQELIIDSCSSDLQIFPTQMSSLTGLKMLHIKHARNLLSHMALWIGKLQSLQELNIKGCVIKLLPKKMALLTRLKILTLQDFPYLAAIPSWIGSLQDLRELRIIHCQFILNTLPTEIGSLTKLKTLRIAGCRRLKTIPSEICNLPLRELRIKDCQLLQIPPDTIRNISLNCELDVRLQDFGYSNKAETNIPSILGQSKLRVDLHGYLKWMQRSAIGTLKKCILLQQARERAIDRRYRPGGPGFDCAKADW
eukprot:CAMPEP_0197247166 /NCGR_PEP_ID=MMETSP1429-20130617/26142_1 /TAXON_ID=49237 /ORGANISM="Chaetoceros  sp., Strain UNC1202" /LENGTH=409 /DNA_ID=CAMNT_0042708005 /DNA_START=36 /DNA_END=1262 /DNA_ORIENTATION=+